MQNLTCSTLFSRSLTPFPSIPYPFRLLACTVRSRSLTSCVAADRGAGGSCHTRVTFIGPPVEVMHHLKLLRLPATEVNGTLSTTYTYDDPDTVLIYLYKNIYYIIYIICYISGSYSRHTSWLSSCTTCSGTFAALTGQANREGASHSGANFCHFVTEVHLHNSHDSADGASPATTSLVCAP